MCKVQCKLRRASESVASIRISFIKNFKSTLKVFKNGVYYNDNNAQLHIPHKIELTVE